MADRDEPDDTQDSALRDSSPVATTQDDECSALPDDSPVPYRLTLSGETIAIAAAGIG
jgi:hypothetical protein